MNIATGLELLGFQSRFSPLVVDMAALFTTVFELKQKLLAEGVETKEVIKKIRTFVNKAEFREQLIRIIYDNTGLTYKLKYMPGPTFLIATQLHVNYKALQTGGYFTDTTVEVSKKQQSDAGNFEKTIKSLEKVRGQLDIDTGKLLKDPSAKRIFDYSAITLYLDPDALFTVDLFHEKAVCPDPYEITAIILHEIGHTLTVYETVSVMSMTLSEQLQTVHMAPKSRKEVEKLYDRCKKSAPDDAWSKRLLEQCRDALDAKPKTSVFDAIIVHFVWVLLLILYSVITTFSLYPINENNLFIEKVLSPRNSYKTSDFKASRYNAHMVEYRADAYVSNYGLSAQVLSGIDRIVTNSQLTGVGNSTKIPESPSKKMAWYTFVEAVHVLFSSQLAICSLGYGDMERRASAIQNSILAQLRSEDIPEEIKKELLVSYTQAKEVAESIAAETKRTSRLYLLMVLVNKIIYNVPGGILAVIFNGNASKHYQELMYLLDDLRANQLIYDAKRLDNL